MRSATLNGVALDVSTASGGGLPLPDLSRQRPVVTSSQSDTTSSNGIQRTVRPERHLAYVWISFECDFTRMVWANLDQPDLNAVHASTVRPLTPGGC